MEGTANYVKRSWIYELSKDELTSWLHLLEVEHEGTLDELRKRFKEIVTQNPERFRHIEKITGTTAGGNKKDNSSTTTERKTIRPQSPALSDISDSAKALNQIRKWGCHFDGRDPLAFLERIDELQEGYGLSGYEMMAGLPELLRGDALMWFRNHKTEWANWNDFVQAFREYYVPKRYRTQLLRELRDRQQKENELYTKYAVHVLTLMRRAGRMCLDEQLEQLFDGLRPEYKLYIRRSEIKTITDLDIRAREFEDIEEARKRAQPTTIRTTTTPAAAYNREECCWRCKQRGHTRAQCNRTPQKFCSQCGKDGVLTRNCHPRPGNSTRAGATPKTPRPRDAPK